MWFDTTHVYRIKHSIFGFPAECAGVGAAKFSKITNVWCGSVQSEKLLCAECAGVPKLAAHKYSETVEKMNAWWAKRCKKKQVKILFHLVWKKNCEEKLLELLEKNHISSEIQGKIEKKCTITELCNVHITSQFDYTLF